MVLLGQPKETQAPILYVPEGTVPNEGEPILLGEGTRTREGSWVSTRTWRFTNKTNGRTQVCCLADDQMSDDAIETAKGEAKENFLRDTTGLPRLVPPSREQRLEVGATIRQIRAHNAKRAESTNGKLFY